MGRNARTFGGDVAKQHASIAKQHGNTEHRAYLGSLCRLTKLHANSVAGLRPPRVVFVELGFVSLIHSTLTSGKYLTSQPLRQQGKVAAELETRRP